MSMFHELMMRKKEEIMYATIKGSLTESPYGVFSGFSGTNYLATQMGIDLSQNWEFSFDFTTSDDITSEQFVFTDKTSPYAIGFGIFTNSKFILYFLNSSGNRVYNFLNSATINTHYKVKITYSNNNISVYINGELVNSQSSNYPSSYIDRIMYIGRGTPTALAFKGSIDLNKSYIKTDNTKYKLQAVVGYTIVGSPTIVDGVVSGFSDANYLTIQQYLPDNFEMFITFTTPNSWTNEYEDIFNYRQLFNIEKYSTNISTYNWTTNSYKYIVPNVKTNTKYSVKIIKEGTSISFWYKEENNDFVLSGSLTTTKIAVGYSCFGINQATSGRFFTGFINLNETYIKSNNKLWFNGQQA